MTDTKKPRTDEPAATGSSRRKFLKSAAAAGGVALLGAPYIRNAEAARGHVWKVQSTWDAGTTGYKLFEAWA
ncbi:MAG: twin-arginine translocation signal domain-containing protein, partial [Gammaproteobacteria bacterium]